MYMYMVFYQFMITLMFAHKRRTEKQLVHLTTTQKQVKDWSLRIFFSTGMS